MKPIKFKEQTGVLLKPHDMTDEECEPLPIHFTGEAYISCWKMSTKERLKALFRGKIWLHVYSKISQPPVGMACDKTAFNPTRKKKTTGYQHFWDTISRAPRRHHERKKN